MVFALTIGTADTFAQAVTSVDSLLKKDSTKKLPHPVFKRPLAKNVGSNTLITNEAVRYYGSPHSVPNILEESVNAVPLTLGDQGFGHETFLMTSRYTEPLISTFLNGILPLNDPISGVSILNYYPVELASEMTITHGGELQALDHGSSDAVNYRLETFRAPIPYSRIHYTQELTHSFSNFEGVFSISPSDPMNIALSVYRRTSGHSQQAQNVQLNPRTDNWWLRSQMSYDTKAVHALIFMLYTTAFSTMNGGIATKDSTGDIFDEQLAVARFPDAYDHRTRFDILAQSGFSIFSEKEPTLLAAYATFASRHLFSIDSSFPNYADTVRSANRSGFSIQQPAALTIGEFSTRALLRGDVQYLSRSTPTRPVTDIIEKRISASASDSISLGGAFGLSASGFFRWTLSQLSVATIVQPDLVFTNFGLEASARLSRALSVTAQATYVRDRATLSPSPTATYDIKNLGAFVSFGVPLGSSDSISISAGYLDRTEPEGIILSPLDSKDSLFTPIFSATPIHSSGINTALHLWVGHFRYSAQAEILPSIHPIGNYTNLDALRSEITSRISGATGIFYESELAEGNLRLSFGLRLRYYNHISPALSYDPASDYYVYQGSPRLGTGAFNDSRLATPKYPIDILASALIDQRAQVNVSFLNLLGQTYYNAAIYPRNGFTFRLDVTWAFLD